MVSQVSRRFGKRYTWACAVSFEQSLGPLATKNKPVSPVPMITAIKL